jgi:N-methylhydantoinase B
MLEAGDGFLVEVGGGGGFGEPVERDLERVLADVRSGYVSLESARRDYGVVIHQQGRRFDLDVEATKALRDDSVQGSMFKVKGAERGR